MPVSVDGTTDDGKETTMSTTSNGRRGRPATKAFAALASLVAVLSMSGMLAAGANAADAAGTAPVKVHSAQFDCDYYQENTLPPIGDHRYAINNTCDGGIKHWFTIGSYTYTGYEFIRPADPSAAECARINRDYLHPYIPTVASSCRYADKDVLPLISHWGTIVNR